MANIVDYLKWRGDLTFAQSPFNDVDNLILSEIAYVDLDGIVPSVKAGGSITLRAASEKFFTVNDEEELRHVKSFIWQAPFVMKEAAATERFGNMMLCNYKDVIDEALEKQFCAFHIRMDKKNTYIAFRGTDDTLVGWKEDFNMSFIMPVPSQVEAAEYINKTAAGVRGNIYLGGHSKGGNLAIYAAVCAEPKIKNKIKCIFNNDGPGFDKTTIGSKPYQEMLSRIKGIVPEHSIVGMLLEHAEDYQIVKSSQTGIMQHDAMSWQVMRDEFEYASALSARSRRLNQALGNWINSIDKEKRADFIEILFGMLFDGGVKNLSDMNADVLRSTKAVIKQYTGLDKETRNLVRKMLLSLTSELGRVRVGDRRE